MQQNSLRRHLIFSVYLPTIILAFGMGMMIPVLPLYARSFEATYAMVGLVVAARGIGNLLGDIPAGVLLSRLGHKWCMQLGVAILGLSMFAMSWAQSVPELVLYGLIGGVGHALWNISRHAYMTDLIPIATRGRAIATFGGINRIGHFAGPAAGGALAALYGLSFPFVIYAATTVAVIVLAALYVTDTDTPVVKRGGLRGHSLHLATVVRTHFAILVSAGAGQLFAQMIRNGRRTIIPLYAADVVGLDVTAVGWVITLAAAVDMGMFYPAGLIMDRFGRKYASVPSFVIQGIGMALVPLTASFGGLALATMVLGFGNGLGSGTMMTLGSDLAPKESMGEFLGAWRLIGDSGQTGAPLVVGGVADLLGLSMATLVLAGFGLAAAGILAFFVPETLRPRSAPAQANV